MDKIAILYGPLGGNTEKVAKLVAKALGEDQTVLIPVKDAVENDLQPYSRIIFGGPTVGTHTWSDHSTKNDWDLFLTRLYKMNLSGKTCAIFGLGDQVSYSYKFVDDMGIIAERLVEAGARLIGKVDADGYEFEDSQAYKDKKFLGLPIDEDNEPEKTLERIARWVELLKSEF